MRIALIDPSLFTLPYDAALAGGLRDAGHDVVLHGRRPRAGDGDIKDTNLAPSFYRVAGLQVMDSLPKPLRLGVKGIDHLVSMAGLGARLRRQRPDVIHFQWLPLPVVDRRFLAGLRRIAPLVLTVHDSNPFNGNPAAGLQRHGLGGSFWFFGGVILHTQQGRARLIAQGVDPERIAVLPHGLLGATRPALPAEDAAGGDAMAGELVFLLFGKIKPYKGLDLLIEAFAQLPPGLQAQARLLAVGKPYMDLAPLRARARELGIEQRLTIVPRFVDDAEIGALFGPGTVATFPYREIEASGVLSLALAHARPILAARLGGFAELVRDGTDGVLVPPDDVAALRAAMARFIADRGFAAACAWNVRALADGIPDWAEIGRRTAVIYRQVQDAARASPAARDAARTPQAA